MDEFIKRSIELCSAVYRVTDKFPKEEVLRQNFRELAVAFIDFLCYYRQNPTSKGRVFNSHELSGKLYAFMAYSEVAKKQQWVKSANFDIIGREYERLAEDFKNFFTTVNDPGKINRKVIYETGSYKSALQKISKTNFKGEKRRTRIIKLLRKKITGLSISEIAKNLGVSTKTVERHLKRLIGEGVVSKQGNKRNVKFRLTSNTEK